MIRTALLAGAFAVAGGAAFANTVNFENEAPLTPDPTLITVGNTYTNGGITFSSTEVMQLVGVGGSPRSGFVPNDTPGSTASGPADFGDVFLTGDFNRNTDMTLSFGLAATIAFDIVDIDGGNDNESGEGQEEQFTFSFLNGANVVSSQLITSNDLTGTLNEAGVVRVSYSGLFDSVEIVGITPGGSRNIGWGIDNIEYRLAGPNGGPAPIPLPAGGVLLLTVLGGLGIAGARKRRG